MIMGDFNARVGCDDVAWKGTIGRHGPDEQNRNGEYLLDFRTLSNLVITNTLFKHRPCHQHTWFHPAERGGLGHVLDPAFRHQSLQKDLLAVRSQIGCVNSEAQIESKEKTSTVETKTSN